MGRRIRLAFVLYRTPGLRAFWKCFLTRLRVAQAKTRAVATSYGLRTSAQSPRHTRDRFRRFAVRSKTSASLQHLYGTSRQYRQPWVGARACGAFRRGARRPGVERPRSLRRQLRRPSLGLGAKRLSRLPKSCTALQVGLWAGHAVAPVSALDSALSAFRARCA